MVNQVGVTTGRNKRDFQGLSTDSKPIVDSKGMQLESGSTFYELNTGNGWLYDSLNINPATSNGWWGV